MSYAITAQRNGETWAQPKPPYVRNEAYHANLYHDPATGRDRWAVLHKPTAVWYFPTRYGMKAAVRTARRLNASAS